MLVAAGKARQRQIDKTVLIFEHEPSLLFTREKIPSRDAEWRCKASRLAHQPVERRLGLQAEHRRHLRLEDSGLFEGDFGNARAQKFRVIVRDWRHHCGGWARNDIGRIDPPAETDLQEQIIGLMLAEKFQRRGGGDLEECDRLAGIDLLAEAERRGELGVAHVRASGALPPGFPPVVIEGEPYWDGGILSNTPLDIVLDDIPRVSTLCFMADLFDPNGPEPATMDEVMARHKDIAYASRTHGHIEGYRVTHNLRRAVNALWQQLPAELQNDPEMKRLLSLGCTTTMNIVHFIYSGGDVLISAKDYDFSAGSLARHRAAGYRDAAGQIARHPWHVPAPPHVGVVVHELPAAAE